MKQAQNQHEASLLFTVQISSLSLALKFIKKRKQQEKKYHVNIYGDKLSFTSLFPKKYGSQCNPDRRFVWNVFRLKALEINLLRRIPYLSCWLSAKTPFRELLSFTVQW